MDLVVYDKTSCREEVACEVVTVKIGIESLDVED
jgi:hypothetical protein